MTGDALRRIRSLSAPVPLPNDELATLLAERAAARRAEPAGGLRAPSPVRPPGVRGHLDVTPRAAGPEPGPGK